MYEISDKEFLNTVNNVHDFMAYTDKFVGNDRGIIYNVSEIPKDSIVLLFGGGNANAINLVPYINKYKSMHGEWPDIVMTGKSANKMDNTSGLGSEVGCFQYILENLGIPEIVTRKYYIEPTDTSTAENIVSLQLIFDTFPELKDRQIVMATYSFYRRRAVHDFAIKMSNDNFAVLGLPKENMESGDFCYERLNGLGVDILMGACFYHSMFHRKRFEDGIATPPSEEELEFAKSIIDLKGILSRYCGWIYPNNLVDLGIVSSIEKGREMIEARRKVILSRYGASSEEGRKEIDTAIQKCKLKMR